MIDVFGGLAGVIAACALIYLGIWLLILLPADMARERHRDTVAWVLVSLLGSPFLAIFLLWILGDADE